MDPADILLDVDTAASDILVSDDQKTATWTDTERSRPGGAERWLKAERIPEDKVKSSRGFSSGRHYWDVEISGTHWWMVGMCYPMEGRLGYDSERRDHSSWRLYGGQAREHQYSVIHGVKDIQLPRRISSDRVRICLDYEAGQLSFYELCDPIRHLHTFTTTFTEPLHVVLGLSRGSMKILRGSSSCEEPSSSA